MVMINLCDIKKKIIKCKKLLIILIIIGILIYCLHKKNTVLYNCKINIIFPMRDREKDLEKTLPRIKKFFENNNLEYHIYVIEQVQGKKFNKGKLFNIGFLEAEKNNTGNYYYFSDVDIYPKFKDTFDLKCIKNTVKHHYTSYDTSLGGVFSVDSETYKKINGFNNNFWGWGGEDDDIMNRINILGIPIDRTKIYYRWDYPSEVYDNLTPNDIKNKLIKEQGKKRLDLKYKKLYKKDPQYIYKNGLNNCKYTIVDYISNENMDTIIVEI